MFGCPTQHETNDEQHKNEIVIESFRANDVGLLTREKRSTWAYYAVVPQALAALADVLTPGVRA